MSRSMCRGEAFSSKHDRSDAAYKKQAHGKFRRETKRLLRQNPEELEGDEVLPMRMQEVSNNYDFAKDSYSVVYKNALENYPESEAQERHEEYLKMRRK